MTRINDESAEEHELETYIDEYGLSEIIEALSRIASAKAEHLRHAWQDDVSAKPWDRDAKMLASVAHKLEH